jgi:ADP-ribose pyrophosphatase YjhB (NUDIX family)
VIKGDNQYINVIVRALIFEEDELVLTEWTTREAAFLVGGRIDFGESIMTALHREVMEETKAKIEVEKLAYFSENIFKHEDGREFHEYGYYFLVQPDRTICPDGKPIPNPDSKDLIIRRVAIMPESLENVWPNFLREYLPRDYAENFESCPHFLYSRYEDDEVVESQALAAAFGAPSF